jgi:hypothetical protein
MQSGVSFIAADEEGIPARENLAKSPTLPGSIILDLDLAAHFCLPISFTLAKIVPERLSK